jgi:hypothetical protein
LPNARALHLNNFVVPATLVDWGPRTLYWR